ncbi:MAG: S49 family peptidase [Acidobacteria bacterium]|nr:S49 family peptidase [Acidobacteriota bacterium]
MKKGVLGCLLVLGVLLAFLILVPVVVVTTSGPRPGSVLELDLQGLILEERPDDFLSRLFLKKTPTLRDLLDAVAKAEADERIAGIFARVGGSSLGWARVQEVRERIQAFRDSGRWAVAYMETAGEFSPGGLPYYLATAFDEIYFAPPGRLNLVGLRAEVPFLRGTLDLLRIEPDVDATGEYKTLRNYYTETEFTPAHRESVEALLDSLYGQMLEGIAAERGMDEEEVGEKIDRGPFLAEEALAEGFVDHLMYFDEVRKALEAKSGGRLHLVKAERYVKRNRPGTRGRHRIALIYGVGTIVWGESSYDPFAGEQFLGSETLGPALREAREDSRVRAIVLRVDSPGGSALGSDLIRREAALAAEAKPLVVSIADVGASGGFLISAPAKKIVVEPATLTGSIGVFGGKMNVRGFYNMIGMTRGIASRGRNSGFFSLWQKFTPSEREAFERQLRGTYDAFLARVAEGRGLAIEEVDRLGQGRVYTGAEAVELGLADEVGGLDLAVRRARELAGIPPAAAVRVQVFPRARTFFRALRERDIRIPQSLRAWARILGQLPAGEGAGPRPGDLVLPFPIGID